MDPAEATRFFRWLFDGEVPDGQHLLIWTSQTKHSRFFTTIKDAVAYAMSLEEQDVYHGLGLIARPPKRGRGKYGRITCITALWADVDVAGPGHKKENLPPTIADARRLVDETGLEPSMVVHSGHGLQAYWLLNESWTLDSDEERAQAATLARRWMATLRAVAKQHEWDLDAVGDLTRVLRVPGTNNVKTDPVPVRLIEPIQGVPRRREAYDFDPLLVAAEFEPDRQSPIVEHVGPMVLDGKADPPLGKHTALLEGDDNYAKSWKHDRPDMQDQSPSAYDLSLATIAAGAGFTDQELTDLMIAARREHGHDLKLRRDYYQRTISKARAAAAPELAAVELEAIVDEAPAPDATRTPGSADEARRVKILKNLSKTFGLHVIGWVQVNRERARYRLQLADDVTVLIGTSNDVLNQSCFTGRVYEATGEVIRLMKKVRWMKVCKALGQIAEVIENVEAARDHEVKEWLQQYLEQQLTFEGDEWPLALVNNEPFVKEVESRRPDEAGQDVPHLHVHVASFRRYLRLDLYEMDVSKADLYEALQLIGFERVTVAGRPHGQQRCRSYWRADERIVWPDGRPAEQQRGPRISLPEAPDGPQARNAGDEIPI